MVTLSASESTVPKIAPLEALKMLTDGNARFVTGTRSYPRESLDRIKETAMNGQRPFVTMLSCSDSRVPLHIIFDQGVGDIFSICVAGNLVGEQGLGSIEYGVVHLGTPLCVVLGHTKCGAVIAACTGGANEGSITSLMQAIRPAVQRTEAETGRTGKEIAESCARHNIFYQIEVLCKRSAMLREAVQSGQILIVGAMYDIENGTVEMLGQHPNIEELIQEK